MSIICDNTTIGSTGFGFDLKNMGSLNIITTNWYCLY